MNKIKMSEEHKCNTCSKEFPTCKAEKVVWGIDRYPSAVGADADKVLECDVYMPNTKPSAE